MARKNASDALALPCESRDLRLGFICPGRCAPGGDLSL